MFINNITYKEMMRHIKYAEALRCNDYLLNSSNTFLLGVGKIKHKKHNRRR